MHFYMHMAQNKRNAKMRIIKKAEPDRKCAFDINTNRNVTQTQRTSLKMVRSILWCIHSILWLENGANVTNNKTFCMLFSCLFFSHLSFVVVHCCANAHTYTHTFIMMVALFCILIGHQHNRHIPCTLPFAIYHCRFYSFFYIHSPACFFF